jgi:drug/metabolite transporter (DMT)-like permease
MYLAIAGVVLVLPRGPEVSLLQPLASVGALWPVLLAGVLGAGIPTVSFIIGIRRLGPSPAAILATLEPVVGVGLAAWLLAEQPTGLQLLGGAFILVAAVLLQLRRRGRGTVADHEAVQREEPQPAAGSPTDLEERAESTRL